MKDSRMTQGSYVIKKKRDPISHLRQKLCFAILTFENIKTKDLAMKVGT